MTITNWREEMALRSDTMDGDYRSIELKIWKEIDLEDGVVWGDTKPGEASPHVK
jgi:hypothetical protein